MKTYNLIKENMNWTEINPYLHFVFPFFDYSYTYNMQTPLQSRPCPIVVQQDLDREYQNIKSYDTQAQLSSDRSEGKPSPNLKNRSIRKQKLLKKREREDNFQRKKQKKDRNLPSNIFKYFASYLYNHPAVLETLENLQARKIDINPKLFISKLKDVIKLTQSYIRPAIIQQLCTETILNKNESLAFRILLRRFLLLDLTVFIAPMQKYKKRQRRDLLSIGRKLFWQIRDKMYA